MYEIFFGETHTNREKKEKKFVNIEGAEKVSYREEKGKALIGSIVYTEIKDFLNFYRNEIESDNNFFSNDNWEKMLKKNKEESLKKNIKKAKILNDFVRIILNSDISEKEFFSEVSLGIQKYKKEFNIDDLNVDANEEIQNIVKKGAPAVVKYVENEISEAELNREKKPDFFVNETIDAKFGIDIIKVNYIDENYINVDLVQIKNSGFLENEEKNRYHQKHKEYWEASQYNREIFYDEEKNMTFPEVVYQEVGKKIGGIYKEKYASSEENKNCIEEALGDFQPFLELPVSQKIGLLYKLFEEISDISNSQFKEGLKQYIDSWGKIKKDIKNLSSVVKFGENISVSRLDILQEKN